MEIKEEILDLQKRTSELERTLIQISAFNNPNSFSIKFAAYYMPLIMALSFTGILAFNGYNAWHAWNSLDTMNKMSIWVMNSPLIIFSLLGWLQFFFSPIKALAKLEELRK